MGFCWSAVAFAIVVFEKNEERRRREEQIANGDGAAATERFFSSGDGQTDTFWILLLDSFCFFSHRKILLVDTLIIRPRT